MGQNLVDLAAYRKAKEEEAQKPAQPDDGVCEECAALAGELADLGDRLLKLAFDAAFHGPWKDWADAQPVGTILEVDREKLLATEDPRVLALVALADQVGATIEQIETGEI